MLKSACAYIRVSKEKEDGVSPEQQKDKAELQARLLGMDLVKIYTDLDITGRRDKRPAFQEMISDIKQGKYEACLVYKIDRFARNPRDFHNYMEILERHGCRFISISQSFDSSTPSGRLMMNILADFAQFESEMIGERVKDNKLAAARLGRRPGGSIPYGYVSINKKLFINDKEAPVIHLAFELRAKGWGYFRIAKELNARGYKPKKQTSWMLNSIKTIISNPIYMGILRYEDVSKEGAVPSLVTTEMWEKAQRLGKLSNKSQQSPNLLTGLLRCSSCGRKNWKVSTSYNRLGEKKPTTTRYICYMRYNFSSCENRILDKPSLDRAVIDEVFNIASDPEAFKAGFNSFLVSLGSQNENIQELKKELSKIQTIMKELLSDYYDKDKRILSREQFQTKNLEYLEKEQLLTEAIELAEERQQFKVDGIDRISKAAVMIKENWECLTLAERKMVLREMIKELVVYPDKVVMDCFGILKEIRPISDSGKALVF